jgi:hypothetical protein
MGQEIALYTDDGFAVAEPTGNRFIIGGIVKYDKHAYTLNKTEPMPLGTVLVVLGVKTAWVQWRDQLPIEHRVTQEGQRHPVRDDLPDQDKNLWQVGLNGKSDPWKDTRYVHAIDPQTGRDYTIVGDSAGLRMAVGELKSAIRNVRIARPGALAVIKLGTGTFKSRKYGLVPRPVFEIVEYRGGLKEVSAPVQIADQSKQPEEVKAPPLDEEMNDDLPSDGDKSMSDRKVLSSPGSVRLNEKGQCPACKKKPLVYKRNKQKFCARCDRSFDIVTGEQVDNWAWQGGRRIALATSSQTID